MLSIIYTISAIFAYVLQRKKALEPRSSKKSLGESVSFRELSSRTRERFKSSGLGNRKLGENIPDFEFDNFVIENPVAKARWY